MVMRIMSVMNTFMLAHKYTQNIRHGINELAKAHLKKRTLENDLE
jgi:hypothetical protein